VIVHRKKFLYNKTN